MAKQITIFPCPCCAGKRTSADALYSHVMGSHPDSEYAKVWQGLFNEAQSQMMKTVRAGIVKSIEQTWKTERKEVKK